MTTLQLLADVQTDLGTVSGLTVYEHPTDRQKLQLPAAVLRGPAEGSAESSTFTSLQAHQAYVFELHAKSDIEDLLDQVRNAIDSGTSTLNARRDVLLALVNDWERVDGGEFCRGPNHKYNATVEVAFLHRRGAL